MVKFQTVIEHRLPDKRRLNKISKLFVVASLIFNTIYHKFIPFIAGFYLAETGNFYWVLLFVFVIFFEVHFDTDKETIRLRIVRGI